MQFLRRQNSRADRVVIVRDSIVDFDLEIIDAWLTTSLLDLFQEIERRLTSLLVSDGFQIVVSLIEKISFRVLTRIARIAADRIVERILDLILFRRSQKLHLTLYIRQFVPLETIGCISLSVRWIILFLI